MQEMQDTRIQFLGWEDALEEATPLQYSCLRNPMERGAWWATVPGVTKSQTWLSTHAWSIDSEFLGKNGMIYQTVKPPTATQ